MKRRLPPPGTIEIAPSILSADFGRLAHEIDVVSCAGLHIVHLDVMDGHFVPNITIGPPVIAKIRQHSDLVFDTHLMISEPDRYIEAFAKAGADHITFHVESRGDTQKTARAIHDLGCTAGLCLNPDTPVDSIEPYLDHIEMILVMTVHPGFGGQTFIDQAAQRVSTIRKMCQKDIRIEVDGGINTATLPLALKYGADTIVAGNAIFGQKNREKSIASLQSMCE